MPSPVKHHPARAQKTRKLPRLPSDAGTPDAPDMKTPTLTPKSIELPLPAGLQNSQHFPDFLSALFHRKKRHVFIEQKRMRSRHRLVANFALFASLCLLLSFSGVALLAGVDSRQVWYHVALLGLATLVVLVLWFRQVFVVPLEDTVSAVRRFTKEPSNLMTMLIASDRADAIGFLQREITHMQVVYRISMKQYQHLAALGGAVSRINHDLKGLLSTALLAGESLQTTKDPKTKRKIRLFATALERAIALCEQLLIYVRQDKKPIFLTRVNLENLLHSLGADLQLHAKGSMKVTTHLTPAPPVQGDADDLYRAFRNLGQNAFEAKAQHLRLTLKSDKQHVHIAINDDGPGLSEQAKQSLFKAFAPSEKVGGSGLGLSISQELIKQHGGSLTLAQSTPKGTTFHCVLPAALGTGRNASSKQAKLPNVKTKGNARDKARDNARDKARDKVRGETTIKAKVIAKKVDANLEA